MSARKAAKKTSIKMPPAKAKKTQEPLPAKEESDLTFGNRESTTTPLSEGNEPKTGRSSIKDKATREEKASANADSNQPDESKDSGTTADSSASRTSDRQSAPRNPDKHSKVVELATQLACAQLSAEASMVSARLTVSGIHRIAAAYVMASARIKMDVETLRSNPDLIDAAFVDRAYADLLRAAEVQELPLHNATPLNHHDHDALFEGAMIRAQRLLRSPSLDTSLVHAEQLFDSEEILSEARVGEKFKECGWPGLSNRADFHKTIAAVEGWFHDHLGRLHFPEEDEQFSKDAEMMGYVLNLGRRRQESDLFRRIYEMVREHELPNQPRGRWTSADKLSHEIWTRHLIDVIFCDRWPSKSRSGEKKITRYYHPWGLFRFLRFFGNDDPAGAGLLERLAAGRNQIKTGAVIHSLDQRYPRSTDFGPLDKLVDKRERQDLLNSSIRDSSNLAADEILLDAVSTLEMPSPLIGMSFQEQVLQAARSGKPFDPTWIGTVRKGLNELLLAGHERPIGLIAGLLTQFYIPLLASYGALKAVLEHRHSERYPHELVDLFPDGWSLSMETSEPDSARNSTAGHAGDRGGSQITERLTLVIRNGAGEESRFQFPMPQPAPESA